MYLQLKILFLLTVLFSGCIVFDDEASFKNADQGAYVKAAETPLPETPVAPGVTETAAPPEPSPASTPESESHRFISWLEADNTNEHPYIEDGTKIYGEQYVCSQFTKDFIRNATDAGFEVYSVGLTGAMRGQNDWHMLAAVVLGDEFFFIDPQSDKMIKKDDMFHAYGYEYAYFGKGVYIGRNSAKVSEPIRYHSIIGLKGSDFIYLR